MEITNRLDLDERCAMVVGGELGGSLVGIVGDIASPQFAGCVVSKLMYAIITDAVRFPSRMETTKAGNQNQATRVVTSRHRCQKQAPAVRPIYRTAAADEQSPLQLLPSHQSWP